MDDILNSLDGVNEEEYEATFRLRVGMVRASFGLYTSEDDINALIFALEKITENRDQYISSYMINEEGNYVHKSFKPDLAGEFSSSDFISNYLSSK